jgi:hypothetical protein
MSEQGILRSELQWGGIALAALLVMLPIIIFSAIAFAIHPPSDVETTDPATLHLRGEFIGGGAAMTSDNWTCRTLPKTPKPAGRAETPQPSSERI